MVSRDTWLRHGRDAYRRIVPAGALGLAGCSGPQSALDPAGRGAESIARLFWWMAAGGAVVWLAVIGLAVYAFHVQPGPHEKKTTLLIIGGGAVVPTLVLAVLLAFGLAEVPGLLAPAPEGSLQIAVTGEQFWWRVRYQPPGRAPFELANEIRLPVGEPVQLILDSPDVIHSFWVPSIAGKMDMIPGRVTRLALEPTKTGTFRGACAEYCGESHALMNFYVVVQEREDFESWLERQGAPAQVSAGVSGALAARGRELFLANGCGACHTVRGTPADGVVGPDLTHVGSRLSLGAGILRNEPGGFRRWIASPEHVKPGALMPAFGMLPPGELRAMAAYLEELK
jgi:cytochrome c oxidase subunit II